ncbi:uncharacterized protein LOC124682110 isoform X1 [Lolium rigidum]|uniref:uncharacterized protein LOC124682110 isoform X1 n=1 Tax=Lolium rigidum TaxID=89674 RepID=UPI001F5CE275|nr:uncharacterized protein LOC124682110 isoform X1 [Lolium rigidum]XP_047072820.1 uncharacterized protein LOC124682110 isoform X1 [Lolium rigidum]XP_047072821.1 uncharacterized protein LOC124682110 isoform X1 [Lolium rigidum]XP_047072822.1 uncharacterized protein LOC124682110 isoform X1 [Lolium rigidum]XP_047072823.1 uncharacterized protein LOC124682110 isoform X1 [Lolium rigidum]
MADNIGEQPSCNYSCTCQDIREQVQWQLPLLKSSSQRQDCRQQVLSLQIGNGCKLIRSERLLSFHFYCCQEFTVYGSCPSVQSKRFGPACRFPLLLEPGGLLFSTSGPALSFLRPMELGKRISCVIKTVRHSGTKLPSLDYLTSKIYEGTEQFILVEESLFLFIQIVLPLWLIYLALMVVLNQLICFQIYLGYFVVRFVLCFLQMIILFLCLTNCIFMMRNENHRMHIFVTVDAEGDQASASNGLPLSSSRGRRQWNEVQADAKLDGHSMR